MGWDFFLHLKFFVSIKIIHFEMVFKSLKSILPGKDLGKDFEAICDRKESYFLPTKLFALAHEVSRYTTNNTHVEHEKKIYFTFEKFEN